MRPVAGSSDCRRMGSNHYPSGQFPKVSVGITVEKCPKLLSGMKNEDRIAIPASKRRPSSQENAVKENKGPGVVEISKPNGELISKYQKASEKLSASFTPRKTPSKQTGHVFPEHTSVLDTEEGILKNITFVASSRDEAGKASAWVFTKSLLHETPTDQKIQFFANQTSVLESQDEMHKKIATVAFRKRLEKGANTERVEEVAFTAMQEMDMLHKGKEDEQPEQVTKCNSKALRLKLWEILGMTSQSKQNKNSTSSEEVKPNRNRCDKVSGTNQIMNSPNPADREASNRNQKGVLLKDKPVEPKQNSDTIETDLESPNEIIRRPVTRSLVQKRAPPTIVQRLCKGTRYGKIPLSSSSSESKLKLEEKNIFIFHEEDAKAVSSSQDVNAHPNRSIGKKSEQKKRRIELQNFQLSRKSVSNNNLKATEIEQTVSPPDEVTPRSKETGSSRCLPLQHDKDKLETSNKVPNVNPHLQSEANKHFTPPLASNVETREHSDRLKRKRYSWEHVKSELPNEMYLQKGVDSSSMDKTFTPSVDFQSPTFAMDASSPPRSKLLNDDPCTPVVSHIRIPSRTTSRSKFSENHKPESHSSNSDTETSDETREIHESDNIIFPHEAEEKETEEQSILFPSKNKDYGSSEESDSFEKGTEEPTGAHEILEQFPEDSLSRAVCQLALVLERFKTKIRSQTCKRSSEILSTAGETVRLQLQHVESQIEADLGKFLNISKSRRKCLESKSQEQQQSLRHLRDKFKEEVGEHLLGCRNILEEIEARKIEQKANLERQKGSHRKLLLQVEEAIESELVDAGTRVSALRKEAKKKMNALKHALKEEWMLEGAVN